MTWRYTEHGSNVQANSLAGAMAGGAIVFFTGTRPLDPDEELFQQVELARIALPTPAFHPASDGKALSVLNPLTGEIAVSGSVTWARYISGSGRVLADVPVRALDAIDSGDVLGTIVVDDVDWRRGAPLKLSDFTIGFLE